MKKTDWQLHYICDPKLGERYHSVRYKCTMTVSKLYGIWDTEVKNGIEYSIKKPWIEMKDDEGLILPCSLKNWKIAYKEGRLIRIVKGNLSEILYD